MGAVLDRPEVKYRGHPGTHLRKPADPQTVGQGGANRAMKGICSINRPYAHMDAGDWIIGSQVHISQNNGERKSGGY